tara:strand:- start:438 stop:602 length:165 start_codon:yes stop_codon:yes gene_type:complete
MCCTIPSAILKKVASLIGWNDNERKKRREKKEVRVCHVSSRCPTKIIDHEHPKI